MSPVSSPIGGLCSTDYGIIIPLGALRTEDSSSTLGANVSGTGIRHLRNPPIAEAIIQVEVPQIVDLSTADVERLAEKLQVPYSNRMIQRLPGRWFDLEVASADERAMAGIRGPLRLYSETDRRSVIVKRHAISLNQLAPYTNWEAMIQEFKRIWPFFVESHHDPALIVKLSVRYINRIEVGPGPHNLSEYILLSPAYKGQGNPADFQLAGFQYRHFFLSQNPPGQISVIENVDPQTTDEPSPLFVDIEAFNSIGRAMNEDDLWENLESLRTLKNKTFFSIMTPGFLEGLE